jgi:hypothetical protein
MVYRPIFQSHTCQCGLALITVTETGRRPTFKKRDRFAKSTLTRWSPPPRRDSKTLCSQSNDRQVICKALFLTETDNYRLTCCECLSFVNEALNKWPSLDTQAQLSRDLVLSQQKVRKATTWIWIRDLLSSMCQHFTMNLLVHSRSATIGMAKTGSTIAVMNNVRLRPPVCENDTGGRYIAVN